MPLKIKSFGDTDKGLVRAGNEDYFHIDNRNRLYIVCDGMGGHQAGEVASMMACDMIGTIFSGFKKQIQKDSDLQISQALPPSGDALVKAVRIANHAINEKSSDNPSLNGMGTTIVALTFEKDILSIAHVGDSRVYRIDEKKLTPLTIDHSWIAEIQSSQNITEEEAAEVVGKNIITRALGVSKTVEVDYKAIKVKAGDKFMLCSDGLCGFADDEDIFDALIKVKDDNEKIVKNLIQLANDRGGSDNVTVMVVEVVETEASGFEPIGLFTEPKENKTILKYQTEWVERVNNFVLDNSEDGKKKTAPSKLPMILIFAAFIIAAIVVVYFATSGK